MSPVVAAELSSYTVELVRHATLLTALLALLFGVLQVRHWRRSRSLSITLELVNTIKTPDFTRAIARVLQLPVGAAAGRVRADADADLAAYVVSHAFESLGLLVYYRMLPLEFVDHLIGGYARSSWLRLEAWVKDGRASFGPTFGEWYQWLVERLLELPEGPAAAGAHVAHRAWRPLLRGPR